MNAMHTYIYICEFRCGFWDLGPEPEGFIPSSHHFTIHIQHLSFVTHVYLHVNMKSTGHRVDKVLNAEYITYIIYLL